MKIKEKFIRFYLKRKGINLETLIFGNTKILDICDERIDEIYNTRENLIDELESNIDLGKMDFAKRNANQIHKMDKLNDEYNTYTSFFTSVNQILSTYLNSKSFDLQPSKILNAYKSFW